MQNAFLAVLQAFNWRMLLLALVLIALVYVMAAVIRRKQKNARKKPWQYSVYKTYQYSQAQCVRLLRENAQKDIFTYTLETASRGGWYINFKEYRATRQMMDTVYLLQMEEDAPATFTISFVREAFGMREPLPPLEMVDLFFYRKLGAVRQTKAC